MRSAFPRRRIDGLWLTTAPVPVIFFSAIALGPGASAVTAASCPPQDHWIAVSDPWGDLRLDAFGFTPEGDQGWMVRSPASGARASRLPRELVIERVADAGALHDFEIASALGFGTEPQPAATWHAPAILDDPRFTILRGRVEGRTVATSMSYRDAGVLGVYGVSTRAGGSPSGLRHGHDLGGAQRGSFDSGRAPAERNGRFPVRTPWVRELHLVSKLGATANPHRSRPMTSEVSADAHSIERADGTIMLPDAPDIAGLLFRRWRGEADLPGLVEVCNAARRAEESPDVATVDRMRIDYANLTNSDPARDLLVAEVDGAIAAYARTEWEDQNDGDRTYMCFGFVHPDWRRRGLGRALLYHNERHLREVAIGHRFAGTTYISSWSEDKNPGNIALLEAEGYRQHRTFFLMVRPGPREHPGGAVARRAGDPARAAGAALATLPCRQRSLP